MTTLKIQGADRGDFATEAIAWDVIKGVSQARDAPFSQFDLTECLHLKPYSLACLCALGQKASCRAELILPTNQPCQDHLLRMGAHQFFAIDDEPRTEQRPTNIPICQMSTGPGPFSSNAMNVWVQEFGGLDTGLQSALETHLDEIITNALTHAESPVGCVVAGQAFPEKRHLEVAVVDLGKTIPKHLRQHPQYADIHDDAEAIIKATEEGVTGTHQSQNSGIGLYELRSFCEQGLGDLVIASGGVYVVFGHDHPPKQVALWDRFPGTLVNARFYVDQTPQFPTQRGIDF